MSELREFTGSEGNAVVDPRSYPLVVTTWEGRPDRELIVGVFGYVGELLERAAQEGTQLVQVVDARRALRPDAPTRALSGSVLEHHVQRYGDAHLRPYMIIVGSEWQRGVLIAVSWWVDRGGMYRVFRDRDQAVQAVVEHYESARGEPFPGSL